MTSEKRTAADAWDSRVQTDPYLWMAEFVSSENDLIASGERDLNFLLQGIPTDHLKGARLLDIGAGIGRITAIAKDRVLSVVAADISGAALDQAKKYLKDSSNVSFFKLNALDLEDLSGPFEIIISFATLCHLPPQVLLEYLYGCHRLATPGGFISLQFYVGAEHLFVDEDSFSIRSYDRERLLHTLQEIGFDVQDCRNLQLPFDGSDHVFNRHPIVITLRRRSGEHIKVPLSLLISGVGEVSSSQPGPRDEEGLVLREVNSYLAQHDLSSARKLLEYWVNSNPQCQPELVDTLRMITESMKES